MGKKIIITGCGTDVGKSVVSAIFTLALNGVYWKPIQSGEQGQLDSEVVGKLIGEEKVYPSAYSFKTPVSPHYAAQIENRVIGEISPPEFNSPLIIETAGGILVPLSTTRLAIDLFSQWDAFWVIVSRHYLGSINHTLLTIEVLKKRNIPISGLIFNGNYKPSEEAILNLSELPLIGKLENETSISSKAIQFYSQKWKQQLTKLFL